MHGCGSGSGLLVNAEVDSMGGVVDGGVGIGIKTSPRRAAIEKAQAELRQEYDVREERRRELEFLEKGGNPLDFKFGGAASVSVQSTSLNDHHAEHFVTSEAKGSFALTASPRGDSVESSGRPGVPSICEPNSADNFHGENELLEGERKVKHPTRRNKIVQSEQSSEMDGARNPKESEDSAIFHSYARRNRSRPNRDAAWSSSTDVVQSSVGHVSSLPVRGGSRDGKGSISDAKSQKEHTTPASIPKSTSNGDVLPRSSTTWSNKELDVVQAQEAKEHLLKDGLPEDGLKGVAEGNNLMDRKSDQPMEDYSQKISMDIGSEVCYHAAGKEQVVSVDPGVATNSDTKEFENKINSVELNGVRNSKGDGDGGQNGILAARTKVLDPELSCTKSTLRLGANNDSELFISQINEAADVLLAKQSPECEERSAVVCTEKEHLRDETMAVESCTAVSDDCNLVDQNLSSNGSVVQTDEIKCPNIQGTEEKNDVAPEFDKKAGNSIDGNSGLNSENICPGGPPASSDKSAQVVPALILSEKNSALSDRPSCPGSPLKLVDKAREDSILEEAQIIEAKRKRIAELSVVTVQQKSWQKTHWDFVLEEMAWLAYDFAQERLWKMTAATQISYRVAQACRLRVEGQNQVRKLQGVSYTLAKAVVQFWNSADVLLNSEDQSSSVKDCNHDSRKLDCSDLSKDKFGEHDKETCNELESQNPEKSFSRALLGYAIRFLKSNGSLVPPVKAEAPATPDRITDLGIMDASWDDNLTEESLFYAVPAAAMETYRAAIESHLAYCEKTGSSVQEEVDTSIYAAAAEIGYHENIYDEEEGETSMYYMPGVYEGSKSTKHDQKKRKVFTKSYSARSYEADFPYVHPAIASQQHALMGKRSGNNLQVGSVPTKRMRTAAVVRQRVIGPFGGSGTVPLSAPANTDASSGDTGSFQDDQSTLHGGFQVHKSMEVDSGADFETRLPYDYAETSTKTKNKKKAKHLSSSYDPAWQLDSIVNNEQRDNSRKRIENHHFDSNGTSGLYTQHMAKKPKIVKQSLDNGFDNISGSIPSPAASQISNMSNSNRFMKIINGQKGRKNKSLKVSAVQPGSRTPWSLFEDQALVVLVHDMGPNWELVSDAINSTLHFKCIFRKPHECKERHKLLMDKGAGDGADSAEDSGSSQSYPSTLPGIPKGSARQLFQRLQGPLLEETLKSHFEKIIMIGKKQLYRRNQNDNQDAKQLAAAHNSHVMALSQVCPNVLNGGLLTPLDLCDASASSPDVLPLVYQGAHAGGLPMPNQGAVASVLPSTGANTLQGSSGMVLGNNSTSPSGPVTAPMRDSRYTVPRASLPADDQQRMQHYNQMLSGRNVQQSNLSIPGTLTGSDRRLLPGASGMGMMPGVSRNMPLSRPAYQGMTSSPMLNSGTMLSSSMGGMPSPGNMHSGTGSTQGNSLMRPREALHMMRPGHNPEHQRQMTVSDIQMQVSQGSSPGIPGFNGLSSGFANQATSPVQGYPGHPQQPHVLNSPHHPHIQSPNQVTGPQQAYAMRLAKERQMQQRLLQQQQQSQLPASSSVQTSTQIQPPSSQPSSMPPLTPSSPLTPISMQQQQKHNVPHHGLNRNTQASATGLNNQIGKQRQRQPQQQQQQFQQSGRHHPQQRQHCQSPQQTKLMKGMGRGNMVMHQNLAMDPSQINGLTVPSGNQGVEKREQNMHLVPGQGVYPGTGLSPMQPSKPLVPQSSNHSQQQPKVFSVSTPPSSKQFQQMPSHSDNSAQGQAHSTHQPISSTMASNHQHLQPESQQKQVSQSQPAVQKIPQLNRQLHSDLPAKSQNDQGLPDQQPVSCVPQMASSTTAVMPQACTESVNAVPVVSSATSQWKQSDSVNDTGLSNLVLQSGSTGSSGLASAASSESTLSASQGFSQRQLSGSLSQHGHNSGLQWQQQPQQSKIPQASQQKFQPQEKQLQELDRSTRLPLQQQSQQQAHLQTAQSTTFIRPTTSKMD